ncbi:TPA: protein YbjH, partial [Escherichia coli]
MIMKNCLLLGALLMGFTGVAMAQSVTVYVPSGYKVVVVPDSVSVPQAVSVATVPQ